MDKLLDCIQSQIDEIDEMLKRTAGEDETDNWVDLENENDKLLKVATFIKTLWNKTPAVILAACKNHKQ